MRLAGLHLLLTYRCNASCRHCFLRSRPDLEGTMSEGAVDKYLDDADEMGLKYFFVEGGEVFLYPDLLRRVVKKISGRGYWVGALTNGFFGTSPQKARRMIAPLAEAGLASLDVSTDAFHGEFISPVRAINVAQAARELGLETSLMVCQHSDRRSGGDAHPADYEELTAHLQIAEADEIPVYRQGVDCRGRAAGQPFCDLDGKEWQQCTQCGERLVDPSRVHIGPHGEIHLCQGILLGRSAARIPLVEIFSSYVAEQSVRCMAAYGHPVVEALADGGPAALARLAMGTGYSPRQHYADDCHLCYDARAFLRPRYPDLLGPQGIYEEPESA